MARDPLLPGKSTQIYAELENARKLLLKGNVLSVDPSIGSLSSMPGYAVYQAGTLYASGTLIVDPKGTKWERLKEVYRLLRNISKQYTIDVCVYEQVPVSAHGGRSQVSHASLLMAVGVTMAAVDARAFIGIPPVSWKKHVSTNYQKGDEQDAIEMGRIVIEMAVVMEQQEVHK